MCGSHRKTKKTIGSGESLSWEKDGKVPHNLAKPELSPGALGLCSSWEAVLGIGQGPCSYPVAQACWVGDTGSAYSFRLPVERMGLLLNHANCLSPSRPQEAGPRLTQCLQQLCRHSIFGHLMPILPIRGQHNPDEATEGHRMPGDHHLVPEAMPARRACAQALGEEHWATQLQLLAQPLQGSPSPLGL